MYYEIGGHLIWVSEDKPHWKEWRGKLVYRQNNNRLAAINHRQNPGDLVHLDHDSKPD